MSNSKREKLQEGIVAGAKAADMAVEEFETGVYCKKQYAIRINILKKWLKENQITTDVDPDRILECIHYHGDSDASYECNMRNAFKRLYPKQAATTEQPPKRITTRRQMRKLRKGDKFYVNGEEMTAGEDAHLIANDASDDDEYIIYDADGEGWFEEDFPDLETTIQNLKDVKGDVESFENVKILDKAIDILTVLLDYAK